MFCKGDIVWNKNYNKVYNNRNLQDFYLLTWGLVAVC